MLNQYKTLTKFLISPKVKEIYQQVISPYQTWLALIISLIILDIIILTRSTPKWIEILEIPLGLLISINICIYGFAILKELFNNQILEIALEDRSSINTELIIIGKFLSRASIILIVVFLFAQTHEINLIGLVASLGIAGAAIAFASQKILEQFLWSIVLYIDRPYIVGDYIHLPDRTLGQVEEIGWRSTKIRLSGKNTLVIVPNSHLAQVSIENLTKARRVILIVDLTFFRIISDQEQALIEQLIIDSTSDIVGIDNKLTQIKFEQLTDETGKFYVKSQAIFFILGAAETSIELRKTLLEIARANIIEKLNEYGINFKFEEKILDIIQPMNM